MDQLGSDYTVDIYQVTEGYTKIVKIDNEAERGKFFNEEVYIVDVKGTSHRYMINW